MDTLPNSTFFERCEAMLGQGRNQFVKTIVSVVFATLTLATFSSNALVIVALTLRRSRPSPFSLAMTLTASMVTADLLLTMSVMPLSVYNIVGESWILGKSTCRLFYTLDIFLCSVSLWHLGGLALDRYLAICRPFLHLRLTRLSKRALCAALWLLPFLLALPLFFLQWHVDEEQESARCLKTLYESGRTCVWLPSPLHEAVVGPLSILVPLLLVAAAHVPIIRASRAQAKRHRAPWLRPPGGDPHKSRSPGGDPRQYQQAVVKDVRPAPNYPGADVLQTMGLNTAESNSEDYGRDGGTSGEGEDKNQPDSKRVLTHGQDNMSIERRKVKRVVFEGESENSDTNNPVPSETSLIREEKPSLKYEGRHLDGTKDHTAVKKFNESYHCEEGFQDKGIVGSNEDSPGRDSNPRTRQAPNNVKSIELDCPSMGRQRREEQPDRPEVKSLQQPDRPEVKSLQQPEDCPEAKRERRERREEEEEEEDPADIPAALQEKRLRERRWRRDDQKALRTVLVLVLCFVLCWVPVLVLLLLQALDAALLPPLRVLTGCQWLGYLNSFINPLLHYKYNRSVRRAVRLALRLPP